MQQLCASTLLREGTNGVRLGVVHIYKVFSTSFLGSPLLHCVVDNWIATHHVVSRRFPERASRVSRGYAWVVVRLLHQKAWEEEEEEGERVALRPSRLSPAP